MMPKWVAVLFGIVLILILLPFFLFGAGAILSSKYGLLYLALFLGIWGGIEELKKYNARKQGEKHG